MLLSLTEWAKANFTRATCPSRVTLYTWVRKGYFPKGAVRRFGRQIFLDTDFMPNATVERINQSDKILKRIMKDENAKRRTRRNQGESRQR